MKKALLLVAGLMLTMSGFAQRASSSSTSFFSTEKADRGISFGVRAGLNLATVNASETKSRAAFNVGVNMDIPIMESFYLQTGLYFSQKGFKIKDGDEKYVERPGYLELPILASYRYNFNDNVQWQFNTGPYLAVGICGKWVEKINGNKDDGKLFGDNDQKRFDAGWVIGTGVSIKKFYVGLAYELGFVNTWEDSNQKNRNFMINVGYNF